ncbi:TetR/AcrR family transcriptional regulator [Streptacidiphilus fuscans]|uniref:TetR/AcrR family transcriptional regulator n=1 Tax=Streptacidiphilus fuscans TaxID=2789292 RepID=A0A931FCM5_9ACTN|nr:TetR/AcrR family transcriptional regulator [Streptacidiphilus fuscans]MBF9069887.1 TetR/AcrR family transcriptional regulator [Streptacidiphilus fuscans]
MNVKPPGRPRSDAARRAILDAAVALCVDGGYANVTMKAIAEAAGVGRQTVYRWWPTRGAVLSEALAEVGAAHGTPPPSGDPVADLRVFLDATFRLAHKAPVADILLGLTSDAFADEQLAATLRGYIAGRRALLAEVLERQGVDGWKVPVPTVVDLVFGAMWYRLMNQHGPVGPKLTQEVLVVVAALRQA